MVVTGVVVTGMVVSVVVTSALDVVVSGWCCYRNIDNMTFSYYLLLTIGCGCHQWYGCHRCGCHRYGCQCGCHQCIGCGCQCGCHRWCCYRNIDNMTFSYYLLLTIGCGCHQWYGCHRCGCHRYGCHCGCHQCIGCGCQCGCHRWCCYRNIDNMTFSYYLLLTIRCGCGCHWCIGCGCQCGCHRQSLFLPLRVCLPIYTQNVNHQ